MLFTHYCRSRTRGQDLIGLYKKNNWINDQDVYSVAVMKYSYKRKKLFHFVHAPEDEKNSYMHMQVTY